MISSSMPPPLTESEVAEAERQLGVRFPHEYRDYLLDVSAGGAVARLGRTAEGWSWAGDRRNRRDLLSVPFPHPDSYAEADDELWNRRPIDEDHPDERTDLEAWAAWDAECEEFEAWKTAGAVIAQDHGHNFATLLVITGPLAGTMWWDGRATIDLIVPLSRRHHGDAAPVTFGEWLGHDSWDLLPPGWG